MKPRRVFVTIEMETDAPLHDLRQRRNLGVRVCDTKGYLHKVRILQVQANVARPEKKAAKKRRAKR